MLMIFLRLPTVFLICLGTKLPSCKLPLPNSTSAGNPSLSVNSEILVPFILCLPSQPTILLNLKDAAVVVSIALSVRLVFSFESSSYTSLSFPRLCNSVKYLQQLVQLQPQSAIFLHTTPFTKTCNIPFNKAFFLTLFLPLLCCFGVGKSFINSPNTFLDTNLVISYMDSAPF